MALLDAFGRPIDDAIGLARPAGAFIVDGQHVADTAQCCHCGGHFVMRRGSKRVRGWCRRCNGITCGAEPCLPCVPFERRLDIMEGRT